MADDRPCTEAVQAALDGQLERLKTGIPVGDAERGFRQHPYLPGLAPRDRAFRTQLVDRALVLALRPIPPIPEPHRKVQGRGDRAAATPLKLPYFRLCCPPRHRAYEG